MSRTAIALSLLIVSLNLSCSANKQQDNAEPRSAEQTKDEESWESKYERERNQRKDAALATVAGLESKHKATPESEWRNRFTHDYRYQYPQYSITVQRAVKALSGRVIVLIVRVNDIFQIGASTYLICEDAYQTHFLLKCTEADVETVLSSPIDRSAFGEHPAFAIAAKLARVKTLFKRTTEVDIAHIPFQELEYYPESWHGDSSQDEVTEMAEDDSYVVEGGLYPYINVLGECVELVRLDETTTDDWLLWLESDEGID